MSRKKEILKIDEELEYSLEAQHKISVLASGIQTSRNEPVISIETISEIFKKYFDKEEIKVLIKILNKND